ncbi:MAG: c-type cytochrome domain-containing protein, partial [Planctomycetota bacterium]|nr:c-type cytochrome domain-containing protein [Planctomycetota bacterium]
MRVPGFIFTLALFSPGMALADEPGQLVSFLETYCVQCHGPEKQKGDRRFDKLIGDFSILKEAELFQEILDQLNLAEMPPKKAKQPPETT